MMRWDLHWWRSCTIDATSDNLRSSSPNSCSSRARCTLNIACGRSGTGLYRTVKVAHKFYFLLKELMTLNKMKLSLHLWQKYTNHAKYHSDGIDCWFPWSNRGLGIYHTLNSWWIRVICSLKLVKHKCCYLPILDNVRNKTKPFLHLTLQYRNETWCLYNHYTSPVRWDGGMVRYRSDICWQRLDGSYNFQHISDIEFNQEKAPFLSRKEYIFRPASKLYIQALSSNMENIPRRLPNRKYHCRSYISMRLQGLSLCSRKVEEHKPFHCCSHEGHPSKPCMQCQ